MVKEAIENPALDVSSALLRGHLGATSPALILDPFLNSRCVSPPSDFEGHHESEESKCFIFEARQKKACTSPQIAALPSCHVLDQPHSPSGHSRGIHHESNGSAGKRSYEESIQSSSYFPVTLYITAVGDGSLAKDISEKVRERLESILTKIPNEQQTNIECGGGIAPLKLRGDFHFFCEH